VTNATVQKNKAGERKIVFYSSAIVWKWRG